MCVQETKTREQTEPESNEHALDSDGVRPGELICPSGGWYRPGWQYYIPEWRWANRSEAPGYELEYVTYSLGTLRDNASLIPEHLLPGELRGGSIERLSKSRYAPFGLRDLTIPSWIKFARRMGEKKKLWKRFREAMFLETV
jgi:hypothetical protein